MRPKKTTVLSVKRKIILRLLKRATVGMICIATFACSFPVTALAENSSWWDKIIDKVTQTTDSLSDKTNETMNTASEEADVILDSASQKAGQISSAVRKQFANVSYEDFSSGWDYYSKMVGTTIAATKGQTYVKDVNTAIKNLENAMNNSSNRGIKQEKGFVAEKWHAETFNVDAVARGVETKAKQLGQTGRASVDVQTTTGEKASMKYYSTAADSASEQAKNILEKYGEYCSKTDPDKRMTPEEYIGKVDWDQYPETYWSIYKDQQRVIPKEQLEDAQAYIEKLIAKESGKEGAHRQAKADGYNETLENLSDRLKSADGTESIPLSTEDAEAIAEVSKKHEFKPSDYNVTTKNVIKPRYVVNQSLKAGGQSAIIEIAMQTGPEIYQIVKTLIEEGKIDEEQLKETGFATLDAGTMGFLEGSISNALLIMCQSGKFGSALTGVSAQTIGNLTVITLDAFVYSYKFYSGEITADQFADLMTEEVVIAVASQTAGTVAQLLIPLPGVYFAASLAASIYVSANYSKGKDVVLALTDGYGFDMITPTKNAGAEAISKLQIVKGSIEDVIPFLKGKIKDNYNVAILDIKTG